MELKLNEYELYSYKDLWEYFGTDYCTFYNRLNVVAKRDNLQISQHWVDPELVQEYIDKTT